MKVYDDHVMIINPGIDASDKQIFANNEFRTNADNILKFVENRSEFGTDSVFRPQDLGDYNHAYQGTSKWMVENGINREPDFLLTYKIGGKKP